MEKPEKNQNNLSDSLELDGPFSGAAEAEMLFVLTFWQESELSYTFPLIAYEFLKHEAESITDYTDGLFFKDLMEQKSPGDALKIKITSMMLSAARKGSAYSQELLRRLYKAHYKREYNALKRFRVISFDELTSFKNEAEVRAETYARILTIAPFFGIGLHFTCEAAYILIRDTVEDMEDAYLTKTEFLDLPEGLFKESLEKVERMLEGETDTGRRRRKFRDMLKFKQAVFRYNGMSLDYDVYLDEEGWTRKQALAITLSILKVTFPTREFSDDELYVYAEVFNQITAYSSHFGILEDEVNMMLGMKDGYQYEVEALRVQPFETEAEKGQPRRSERISLVPAAPPEKADSLEDLRRENEELRTLLQRARFNLKSASAEQAEARRTIRQLQAMEQSQSGLLQELHALREFAYQSTEDDIIAKEPDYNALKNALRTKRVVIIGGHDNWTSQLRESFPGWVFVKPGPSGAGDVKVMDRADAVYFFTGFISHATYGKYVQYAREMDIPFGYIHSTNIRANMRQIAGDLKIMEE